MMPRIRLGMKITEAINALAEGNVGAEKVLLKLLRETPFIDPDDESKGLQFIFFLDELGVYGHRLWMLYKDVCGCDLAKMIAVLRAYEFGDADITKERLNYAIDNYGAGINLENVIRAVKNRLPNFRTKS